MKIRFSDLNNFATVGWFCFYTLNKASFEIYTEWNGLGYCKQVNIFKTRQSTVKIQVFSSPPGPQRGAEEEKRVNKCEKIFQRL